MKGTVSKFLGNTLEVLAQPQPRLPAPSLGPHTGLDFQSSIM